MATWTPTRGIVRQWKDSIPVEQRLSGVDHAVLRRIREISPTLILRWHPALQRVSIWQRNPRCPDDHPALLAYSPFGPYIDNRLVVSLAAGDRTKYPVGPTQTTDEYIRARDRAQQARLDAKMTHIDAGEFAYDYRQQLAAAESIPWGTSVQVHPAAPVGGGA